MVYFGPVLDLNIKVVTEFFFVFVFLTFPLSPLIFILRVLGSRNEIKIEARSFWFPKQQFIGSAEQNRRKASRCWLPGLSCVALANERVFLGSRTLWALGFCGDHWKNSRYSPSLIQRWKLPWIYFDSKWLKTLDHKLDVVWQKKWKPVRQLVLGLVPLLFHPIGPSHTSSWCLYLFGWFFLSATNELSFMGLTF